MRKLISDYELKHIPVKDLVFNKLNPSQRIRKGTAMTNLTNSIKQVGVIIPITIDSSNQVIDGHRRTTAVSSIDPDASIPCICIGAKSKKTRNTIYRDAQLSEKLNAAQELEIYLNKGADMISETTLKNIKELEEMTSRKFLMKIASMHKSPNTFLITIRHYLCYVKMKSTDKSHINKLVYYLMNVSSCYKLRAAMDYFIDSDSLKQAVESREELQLITINDIKVK